MLRVASFSISDEQGINALLDKYRLAQGAHIIVSDGHVCIPYEDGEPKTNAQKIIDIKEQKNTIYDQIAIIEHSQTVMDYLMADAKERVNAAQAAHDNATSDKKLEAKLKEAQGQMESLENQYNMNKAEIIRLNVNLEKFDEQIASLS